MVYFVNIQQQVQGQGPDDLWHCQNRPNLLAFLCQNLPTYTDPTFLPFIEPIFNIFTLKKSNKYYKTLLHHHLIIRWSSALLHLMIRLWWSFWKLPTILPHKQPKLTKFRGRMEVGRPLFLCQNLPNQGFTRTDLPTRHPPDRSSGPQQHCWYACFN